MSETLSYGLGAGGFVRMRLPEIRRAIFDDIAARTGVTLDETPDSYAGQFVAIFAEREAALWELAEKAYLSAYPATATGQSLALAVSYAGVVPIQPSPSRAMVRLRADLGTTIPQGTVVRSTVAAADGTRPPRFALESTVIAAKTALVDVRLRILATTPVEGTVYWVELDGVRRSHTSTVGQTMGQIAAALNVLHPSFTRIANTLNLTTTTPFSVDWSEPHIELVYADAPGSLLSEENGPVAAAAGTLTDIVTPVAGLTAVTNPGDASLGTLLETDDALRRRYALGVYRLGAGTMPSIRANLLQDIVGLTSLAVYENPTSVTDAEGRTGHSVEVVIEGGDDATIARRIFEIKAAGITSHGNTTINVAADDGYLHPIKFSRPELRWVWLRVTLTTTTEEAVPGDFEAKAVAAILAAGAAHGPGQNVLLQRLGAAVFPATAGVARVTITAAVTAVGGAQPVSYSSNDIAIGARQKAVFDVSRVEVI
jgi:uncharacterized phage protein gp47/JayE